MGGSAECYSDLQDPRTGNATRHLLLEVPMIALCAMLCGGGGLCGHGSVRQGQFVDVTGHVCLIETQDADEFRAFKARNPCEWHNGL